MTSAFYCSANKHCLKAYCVPGTVPVQGQSGDGGSKKQLSFFLCGRCCYGANGPVESMLSSQEHGKLSPVLPWEPTLLPNTFTQVDGAGSPEACTGPSPWGS